MDQAEYLQEKTFVDAIRLIKSMLEELPKEIEKNVFGWVKKIVAKNPKTKISQIVGKKIVNIPFLGLVLELLQSKIASFFTLVFLVLIFGYNRYMYTKKKERLNDEEEIKYGFVETI